MMHNRSFISTTKLSSIHLICIVYLWGFTTPGIANDNKSEKIHIQADHMYFDLEADTSTYKGNVKIQQGTMALSGERVDVEHQDNTIVTMRAHGSPAKYHQVSTEGKNINAQSKYINYFAKNDRLVMIDNAILIQDEQTIESERIVYDTKNHTLLAGNKENGNKSKDRVKITLTPNEKKPSER